MNLKQSWKYLAAGIPVATLAVYSTCAAHPQGQDTVKPNTQTQKQIQIVNDESDDVVLDALAGGRSWLGVETSEVTKELVKEDKLPAERGVLVSKVISGSPAAKAGLKEKDVITEVNGQRVEGTEQFHRVIREIPAGRDVEVTVWRDGRAQNMHVVLGKSESAMARLKNLPKADPGQFVFTMPELPELSDSMGALHGYGMSGFGQPHMGIDAEDVSGAFGNYFGAPNGEGVLVRDVFENSAAAKAGLRAGDVIVRADGQPVRNVAELREKMHAAKDSKSLKLGVIRNKAEISVDVELPQSEKHDVHQGVRTSI